MNWTNNEMEEVVNLFQERFDDKFLSQIKREDIKSLYNDYKKKYDNLVPHSIDSVIALAYNIISILTEEQYGLSGYSKTLENIVLNSNIRFSKQSEKFYVDEELYDDVDSDLVADKMNDNFYKKGASFEDFHKNRIIPMFLDVEIESFIAGYKRGKYNLDPNFQREFIWSKEKQQNLIESIFSTIPIPRIYSYELKDQNFEIVDGKQRLYSILNFYQDGFELSSKFKFKEMQNKKYSELNEDQKCWFLNFTLSFMKIPFSGDEQTKYDIFDKLNNNSVALNFQELRNSIFRSKLNDAVKELAKNDETINIFLKNDKSKRMQNVEMLFRFLSLKDKLKILDNTITLVNHQGIKQTIDNYMSMWTRIDDKNQIDDEINKLKQSFKLSYKIFELNSFKSFDTKEKEWKKAINRPLMDSILLNSFLAINNEEIDTRKLVSKRNYILEGLKKLFENDREFSDSFLSATGNNKSIQIKLNKIFELYYEFGKHQ